jgi:hypothetical protein
MTLKVIQWYTGQIAKYQIGMVSRNPALELVGAVVHHPEKEGLDVGEIAGLPPLGVITTRSWDEALALDADVVLVNGLEWKPEMLAAILRSGKNVLTTWGGWYLRYEPEFEELEDACREGGSSLAAAGNQPGLVNDAMPLFCSGFTTDVTSVRTEERDLLADNASKEQMLDFMGISRTIEDVGAGADSMPVQIASWAFRQSANMIADAMGVRLEDFRATDVRYGLAPEDFYLEKCDLLVPKGTIAGIRWEYTGFVDSKPWLVHTCEISARLGLGGAFRDRPEDPEFTVEIEGTPSIRCTFETTGSVHTSTSVLHLNAARIVNLIPRIVAAAPGCRSILDLPPVVAGYAHASTTG